MVMQVSPLNPDEDESQENEDITRDTSSDTAQTEQCAVTNRKCDISLLIISAYHESNINIPCLTI